MPTEASPLLENGGTPRAQNVSYTQPTESQNEATNKSFFTLIMPMAFGIFLAALDGTIVVSSYASIGSELNELQATSWIATAYLLTMTSFQPLYGKLSDIFGRKACLLFAYTIFATGCLMCGLARNMTELVASRAFAGVGGGGMTTIVSIIVSDVVPLRSRGTWQGLLNIVFTLGSATGAPLGGFLADTIGWRWAFLIQVPIAIIAILSVSLTLKVPPLPEADFKAKFKRVDFSGALSLVLCVFFLLFGLDRGGNVSWTSTITVVSLSLFAVFTVLFILVETKHAAEPFAPKRIVYDNTPLLAAYLVNFFGFAAALPNLFQIALYLQAVLAKSASQASLWLILAVGGALTGSLTGGLIIQKTGNFRSVTIVAYGLLFVGTTVAVCMMGVVAHFPYGIAAALFTASIGNGAGVTTSLVALIAHAGPTDQAIATAVSYLFRSLGSVVGVSIASTLVQDNLRSGLRRALSGEQAEDIIRRVRESLKYVDSLDPELQTIVRGAYEKAIQFALWFAAGMALLAFVSSFWISAKELGQEGPTRDAGEGVGGRGSGNGRVEE